ncbi:MAG: ATP synthase F1 subunit delta [Candidatus Acidiferrales bacterium]
MSAVAERYAAALADVALEHRSASAVRKDLAAFVDTFFASADLRNALETPALDQKLKDRIIAEIAQKMKLNDAVRNFIMLIVRNRRTHLLRDILPVFYEELNRRQNILELVVTSARKLPDRDRTQLMEVFKNGRPGMKIEATFGEDEALLGGVVVRAGSTVYDGSVRERLNRLRERLETE